MLKTLNNYIEEADWRASHGLDRRFVRILAASIIGHVIFYVTIVRLDIWTMHFDAPVRGRQTELVQIAEVAPSPDRAPLRTAPGRVERADLDDLKFDENNSDDLNLVSRSPRLGSPRGTRPGPSPAGPRPPREASLTLQPPSSAPVQMRPVPQQIAPLVAQPSPSQAAPPPPAPAQNPTANAPSTGVRDAVQKTASREESAGTKELSLQTLQARYEAAVRSKIWAANEQYMSTEWIRDILRERVSAAFVLKIGRGGRLLSVQLNRSSGSPLLDDKAREAIYMARPFDGYPQDAGDTITLIVTVYYTPRW